LAREKLYLWVLTRQPAWQMPGASVRKRVVFGVNYPGRVDDNYPGRF